MNAKFVVLFDKETTEKIEYLTKTIKMDIHDLIKKSIDIMYGAAKANERKKENS